MAYDKPASQLEPSDYVRHLWRRRLWIAGLVALTLVGTYLGLVQFHSNLYESRALVMVREQPRMSNMEDDQPGINPPAFRSLFTSDEMVEFVRNQYNEMVRSGHFVNQESTAEDREIARRDHQEIKAPLEKYRSRFRAQAATEVDTTISTQYSPVIELTVRGASRGQTKALMEIWLNRIMAQYGNLLNEEADFLIQSSRSRTEELTAQVQAATAERRRLESEQLLLESRLASLMRQLTSAPLPELDDPFGNDIIGYNMYSGPRESNLVVKQLDGGTGEPGLWERRTQVALRIAQLEKDPELAESAEKHLELVRLRNELQEINSTVPRIESAIVQLNDQISSAAASVAGIAVELNRLEYAVRLNSTVSSQAEGLLRAVNPNSDNMNDRYSTLRVLARPQLPNLRVWPKRILISGIAAGAMLILLLIIFSAEVYLRHAVNEE